MNSFCFRTIVPALLALGIACASGAALAAEFRPIHGFWQDKSTPCGKFSDYTWKIDAKGASPFEALCKLRSASRKDNRFTLKQQCAQEGMVENTTTVFRLVNQNEMQVGSQSYRRCPGQ